MKEWRRISIPTSMIAIQIMLGLAKAIQYFHSMGVILHRQFGSDNVFLDSDLRPIICCLCSTSRFLLEKPWKERFVLEDNIFSFGCLLYEEDRMGAITNRPSVPEMPEFVWQLVQRCCAEDPKRRPPMDEVVQEVERWNIA
ncbi:hypothetical protein M378DRAFT_560737 [Amanita muscaria Koide BX008]|uniref:Protein kinase domain-containing protein n=1 Tax=Amanita muscaria (strain Koide BX008) TaxID=946122 RepID=A0A0C2RZP5_AMAMK|nr:hypothetical protein M378DRAFT_560737 [Amanita muscaria Koide BX008]